MTTAVYPSSLIGTQLHRERCEQVEELVRVFEKCRPINTERSVFDLPFELADGRPTYLRIILPPHFPQERPLLQLMIPVQHPDVDNTGRVKTAGWSSWTYPQSRVKDVVSEAYDALRGVSVSVKPLVPMAPYVPTASTTATPPSLTLNQTFQVHLPNLSKQDMTQKIQTELSTKSISDLEKLLTDDAACREFMLPIVKSTTFAMQLNDLRRRNIEIASANVHMQSQIEEAKNAVVVVKSSEYNHVRQHYDQLLEEQKKVVDILGPEKVLERLESSYSQMDARAERVKADFIAGTVSVEEFHLEYNKHRKEVHILTMKREAAYQLLRAPAS